MKRFLVPIAMLAVVTAAAPARTAAICEAPRCHDVRIPLPPGVSVAEDRVRVLLPQDYENSARAYPVLYLLHGVGDTYRTIFTNTSLLEMTAGRDVIVVMPDGGRTPEAGWYSDWADGSRQWETFHIDVVVPFIDASFRTLGDGHRAIAGISMGGFGAMHHAARHPGTFEAAASFSGAVDMMYAAPASGAAFAAGRQSFGTPDERVWGDQLRSEATWRANNPTDLAAKLSGTELFLSAGNGLAGGRHDDTTNAGAYAVENAVWQMNLSFVRALDAAGVAHTDNFYGPGQHGWGYWNEALAWALPHLLAAIA